MALRDSIDTVIARHAAGETLASIGDSFGVTRERVRQVLKQYGKGAADGGVAVVAARRRASREARLKAARDVRMFRQYGCDHETVMRLNGGHALRAAGALTRAYYTQRHNAETRGIAWEFTFPTWCAVWEASGHQQERGRRADAFVMARFNDVGPYNPANVYITTMAANGFDYQQKRLAKLGLAVRGYTYNPRLRTRPYSVKARGKHVGFFSTPEAAHAAYLAAKAA